MITTKQQEQQQRQREQNLHVARCLGKCIYLVVNIFFTFIENLSSCHFTISRVE